MAERNGDIWFGGQEQKLESVRDEELHLRCGCRGLSVVSELISTDLTLLGQTCGTL